MARHRLTFSEALGALESSYITEEFATNQGSAPKTCKELFTRLYFTLEIPQQREIKQQDVSARDITHTGHR